MNAKLTMAAMILVLAAIGIGACGEEKLVIRTVSEYNPNVPAAGIFVQVNNSEWKVSDENGKASFGLIEEPFTVRVYQISVSDSGNQYDDVWELIEQTDNPLVIEVDGSFIGEWRKAIISGQVVGRSGGTDSLVHNAGPDSLVNSSEVQVQPDDTFSIHYNWQGPSPYNTVLRFFEHDANEPPKHYFGYASNSVTLEAPLLSDSNDEEGSLSGITMKFQSISEEHATGQVTIPDVLIEAQRYSSLSIIFPDGTSSFLGTGSNQPLTFDYIFPVIDGCQASLFYSASTQGSVVEIGGFEVFQNGAGSYLFENIALPSTELEYSLPEPVTLIEPEDQAEIHADTVFRWSASPEADLYHLKMRCRSLKESKKHHVNFRTIQTKGTQATLPNIPNLSLAEGAVCIWEVVLERKKGDSARYYSNSGDRLATFRQSVR